MIQSLETLFNFCAAIFDFREATNLAILQVRSGARIILVSGFFWCQENLDTRNIRISGKSGCQKYLGIRMSLTPDIFR
jgi:hypothetical protein